MSGWTIYTDAEAMTVPLGVDEVGPGETVAVTPILDAGNGGLITIYDGEGTQVASAGYDAHPDYADAGDTALSVDGDMRVLSPVR